MRARIVVKLGPVVRLPSRRMRARIVMKLDLLLVVLFFEIMLVGATVVIAWFALYTLYRLITDES